MITSLVSLRCATRLTGISPNTNQRNLTADSKYADKLAEMEALLLSEMRRLDDPYRLWNQPDDGLDPPNLRSRPAQNKKKPKRNDHSSKVE